MLTIEKRKCSALILFKCDLDGVGKGGSRRETRGIPDGDAHDAL